MRPQKDNFMSSKFSSCSASPSQPDKHGTAHTSPPQQNKNFVMVINSHSIAQLSQKLKTNECSSSYCVTFDYTILHVYFEKKDFLLTLSTQISKLGELRFNVELPLYKCTTLKASLIKRIGRPKYSKVIVAFSY